MKKIVEANPANFASEVLNSNQPVIVDVWAGWRGLRKMLAPLLEEIATEHPGRVKIAKIPVDENRTRQTARYPVRSGLTLLFQWPGSGSNHWRAGQEGNFFQAGKLDGTGVNATAFLG